MTGLVRIIDFPFRWTAIGLIQLYRYTLSAFLDEQLDAPAALAHWEGFIVEAVMRTVSATGSMPAA